MERAESVGFWRFVGFHVRRTDRTPKTTTITFTFLDGQTVDYRSDNVILEELTREEMEIKMKKGW